MAPKFQETADLSDQMAPRMPQLKLCRMTEEGSLSIPNEVRDKWLSDPVRSHLDTFRCLPTKLFVCLLCFLFSHMKLVVKVETFESKTLIGGHVSRTLTVCSHQRLQHHQHPKQQMRQRILARRRLKRLLHHRLLLHVQYLRACRRRSSKSSIHRWKQQSHWPWGPA